MFEKAKKQILVWSRISCVDVTFIETAPGDERLVFFTDQCPHCGEWPTDLADDLACFGYSLCEESTPDGDPPVYTVELIGEVFQRPTKDDSSMRFIVKTMETVDPQAILGLILLKYPTAIRSWVERNFYVENADEYEGGIDCWWGLGSVTLCELAMKFSFTFKESEIIARIST